jgi:AcrR family transcriptional regulator
MRQVARSANTRRRLLEAALEVFTAEGFRNATIQQICARAGANIAAAHYHFGGKEELYAAVFEHAVSLADRRVFLDGLGTVTSLATVTVRTRVDGQLVSVPSGATSETGGGARPWRSGSRSWAGSS